MGPRGLLRPDKFVERKKNLPLIASHVKIIKVHIFEIDKDTYKFAGQEIATCYCIINCIGK